MQTQHLPFLWADLKGLSVLSTASETLQAEAEQAKPVQERCEPEVVAITSMQKQPLVHHH